MVIYQLVILGAGPAGLGVAIEAIKKGYKSEDILILEKAGEISHMISTKYPDEKKVLANYKNVIAEDMGGLRIEDMSKKEFMSYMSDLVKKYNLNILFHQSAEKITKLHSHHLSIQTSSDTYLSNSVFIAIGTSSSPRSLSVDIEKTISNKIVYDIQNIPEKAQNILVVGGGDSASEYSQILIERGHDVTLSYRGSEFLKMIDANRTMTQELIDKNKLRFLPSTNIRMVEDHSGKAAVFFKETYQAEYYDFVVTALGTEKPTNYLRDLGLTMCHEGKEIYSESSLKGVFVVGDLASSKRGGSINYAFNSGAKALNEAFNYFLDR